jgi:hypothetical protein
MMGSQSSGLGESQRPPSQPAARTRELPDIKDKQIPRAPPLEAAHIEMQGMTAALVKWVSMVFTWPGNAGAMSNQQRAGRKSVPPNWKIERIKLRQASQPCPRGSNSQLPF